jgi:hypothetical protein
MCLKKETVLGIEVEILPTKLTLSGDWNEKPAAEKK